MVLVTAVILRVVNKAPRCLAILQCVAIVSVQKKTITNNMLCSKFNNAKILNLSIWLKLVGIQPV